MVTVPFSKTENSQASTDAEDLALSARLDALFSLRGPERAMKLGLDRVRGALEVLGFPERRHPALLVAGTNGKGSTTLYLTGALLEGGYSVATYLSPHLYDARERFLHDLEPIEAECLETVANEVKPVADRFELTWFEHATVTFFLWASRLPVDFIVVEVGMGGRLDATNVLDPVATCLTNVGLDHQQFLGDTVEAILEEKLGVVKEESLLFTGIDAPHLRARVQARCEALDAIYYYASELPMDVERVDWTGQRIRVSGVTFDLACPSPGAARNAQLAFLCLRIAIPKLSLEAIQRGFARVRNPARFETVAHHPRVIVSGDHNPDGIADLLATFARFGEEAPQPHVIAGFSPGRPFAELLDKVAPIARTLRLVPVPGRETLPPGYAERPEFQPDADAALTALLAEAAQDDVILVTGSLYLAGALRRRFRSSVCFQDR